MPIPDQPFDFSVLQSRIKDIKDGASAISEEQAMQKNLANYFVRDTLLPILNTPNISALLQNPLFVVELTKLLGQFAQGAYMLGKSAYRKPNE